MHAEANKEKIKVLETGNGVECPVSPSTEILESKYGVFLRPPYASCNYYDYTRWIYSGAEVPVVWLFIWAHRKCTEAEMDEVRTVCNMTAKEAVDVLVKSVHCMRLDLVLYVKNHWVFDPPTAFARGDDLHLLHFMSDHQVDGVRIMDELQSMFRWTTEEAATRDWLVLRMAVGGIESKGIELPENTQWVLDTYKPPKDVKHIMDSIGHGAFSMLEVPMKYNWQETLRIVQDYFKYTPEEINETHDKITRYRYDLLATKGRDFLLSISGAQ